MPRRPTARTAHCSKRSRRGRPAYLARRFAALSDSSLATHVRELPRPGGEESIALLVDTTASQAAEWAGYRLIEVESRDLHPTGQLRTA
jgi:hypothetical protein